MEHSHNRSTDSLYAPKWVSRAQEPKELHSEILPGLFQGGTVDAEWDYDGGLQSRPSDAVSLIQSNEFDAVVSLFAWSHPCDWGVEELRYAFYDAELDLADKSRVVRPARGAHERWKAGDRVLIRCQAGLNRSGLITALVMMLDGWSAQDAIRHIREWRAEVSLVNDDFVDWLVGRAPAVLGLEPVGSAPPCWEAA